MDLHERLTTPGPKRILSLDGGGIRGLITLGMLERIEAILRDQHDDPALRLADYFDLIGGTSSGSIIAAGLALGLEVAEIRESYLELAGLAFGRRRWQFWKARFDAGPLEQQLRRLFAERTLGDPSFTTGLCIFAKRADTAARGDSSIIQTAAITRTTAISSCASSCGRAWRPRSTSPP
ncbi:MAG: patatin-like phospholipase family protein [Dehalococcoidia bacterium]